MQLIKYPELYYAKSSFPLEVLQMSLNDINVKNFIFSSTAAVYKDKQAIVHEKSEIKPKSVYGKTKLKAEKLIISNCNKMKINYGILRYFNVAGADSDGEMGQEKKEIIYLKISL